MSNPDTTIHHPDLLQEWTGPQSAALQYIVHGGWLKGPLPGNVPLSAVLDGMSVAEVLNYAAAYPAQTAAIVAAEQACKGRKGILNALTEGPLPGNEPAPGPPGSPRRHPTDPTPAPTTTPEKES